MLFCLKSKKLILKSLLRSVNVSIICLFFLHTILLSDLHAHQKSSNLSLKDGRIHTESFRLNDTGLRICKAIGIINATPERVWSILLENNKYKEFMPRTKKSRIIDLETVKEIMDEGLSDFEKIEAKIGGLLLKTERFRIKGGRYVLYFYSRLNFPWPIGQKWYILKLTRDESQSSKHIFRSSWKMILGNLKRNEGGWILEPYGRNKTKVTYFLYIDPGIPLPRTLINFATLKTLPGVIKALRERVEGKK